MNENGLVLTTRWQDWRSLHGAGNNARETAYQTIRDKIINLEFKPGEPLSDKQLAEQLQMSRTPVHEALIILSTSNMVILKPQIGTFVAPIDVEWLKLEQFARFALEKEVVSYACARMTDELATMYEHNLDAYRSEVNRQGEDMARRLLDLDNSFHRIAFIAANRETSFFHLMNSIQHIERLRMLSLRHFSAGKTEDDHLQISQAIVEGNVVRAQYWLEQHLHRYQADLEKLKEESPEYFRLG